MCACVSEREREIVCICANVCVFLPVCVYVYLCERMYVCVLSEKRECVSVYAFICV